ncbi:MAG TPA: heme o synthase [Phycisphaerales bacterium]|nr:heme o synthase [Phycisphaerales bacterium]
MAAPLPSTAVPTETDADAGALAERPTLGQSIYELTKPRITRMVAITSGVGFMLGAVVQHWEAGDLAFRAAACVVGTMLSASGANALNQWWERDRDAVMPRTCARPLPQARVSPTQALWAGLGLGAAGVGLLALIGLAPALVSLLTILIYVLLYTPLKPVTTVNTLIGAVPGALPPLIGWTAAATGNALYAGWAGLHALWGPGSAGGWSLFLLMFVWQIPHFLAIAWMYRDDYAKGGYRMLPISDPDGRRTASMMLLWAVVQIPATIAPAVLMHDRLGPTTVVVATVTGLIYAAMAFRLCRTREIRDAKRVFFASIIHLPLLLMVMVGDAMVQVWWQR